MGYSGIHTSCFKVYLFVFEEVPYCDAHQGTVVLNKIILLAQDKGIKAICHEI